MIKVDKTLSKKITILLTVYNRNSLTIRWLEFADFFKVPFFILVADAGKSNFIKNYIKKRNFKNIKIRYKKYKYYTDWKNYNEKFFLATKIIKTKYTYLCEAEDFFIIKNILKSVSFLEKNIDFVCSGSLVLDFDINFEKKEKFYCIRTSESFNNLNNFQNKSSYQRFIRMIKKQTNCWNLVHRSKNLKKNLKQIQKYKLKDLYMHETAFNVNIMLQGKMKRFKHIEYLKTSDNKISSSNLYKNSNIFSQMVKFSNNILEHDAKKIFLEIKNKLYSKSSTKKHNKFNAIKKIFFENVYKKHKLYKEELTNKSIQFRSVLLFIFKKIINYLNLRGILKKIHLTFIVYGRYKNYYLMEKKIFLMFSQNKLFFNKLNFFLENFYLNKKYMNN